MKGNAIDDDGNPIDGSAPYPQWYLNRAYGTPNYLIALEKGISPFSRHK
jgi:hypothetical protein